MAYSAMKDVQLYVGKSSTNIFVHDFHEMIAMNGLHYKDILMNVVFSCDTYELWSYDIQFAKYIIFGAKTTYLLLEKQK